MLPSDGAAWAPWPRLIRLASVRVGHVTMIISANTVKLATRFFGVIPARWKHRRRQAAVGPRTVRNNR